MASLEDLGLSEYESRAYRALLETGPATARELSEESDVPMGRVYDVLNGLETRNLVRSQVANTPKRYAPVDPETALDRLLADRKRELEERKTQYEAVVAELTDELEPGAETKDPFWTAALGSADAADLLVDRLDDASDRIVVVADAPTAQFELGDIGDRVVTALETALDRGVPVSLLLHPSLVDSAPEDLIRRYRQHLRAREGFAVRTSPEVSGTFELIDRTEVCFEVPHPLDDGRTFAVIDLEDPDFAAGVRTAFEECWADADPLSL